MNAAVLDTAKPRDLGALGPVSGIAAWAGADLTLILLLLDALLLLGIIWASWRSRRLTAGSLRRILGRAGGRGAVPAAAAAIVP